MNTKQFLRKSLQEIYKSDQVFIRLLEKAVTKASLPRVQKSIEELLKDSRYQIATIEQHLR